MVVTTRICDLCGKEVTEYIPQIQIMGKPRNGWRMTGYSEFNDLCQDCHDKIFLSVLGLRAKGAAFRVNVKDQDNDDTQIRRENKKPQFKKHLVNIAQGVK